MADSLDRLFDAVHDLKKADPARSRTARLMRAGRSKIAKKLGEEAVEVVIDAMQGDRDAVVRESADLLYNLVVLWVSAGDPPAGCLGRDEAPGRHVRHRRETPEERGQGLGQEPAIVVPAENRCTRRGARA